MNGNLQQQFTNREVMEAREFLKAACSQPSGDADGSRPSLAGRFDLLSRHQAHQPSVDPPLGLLSTNWVPVGTRPVPPPESSDKAEKNTLHRIFSQQTAANEALTAEALARLQAQAQVSLLLLSLLLLMSRFQRCLKHL